MRCLPFAVACCVAFSLSSVAHSADLGMPMPPLPEIIKAPIDIAGGWYVRADASYRANHLGSVTLRWPRALPTARSGRRPDSESASV
jgi:hypothetical protein